MTEKLLDWYKKNKRSLPWRGLKTPYNIWISEIILQQTQIKTGIKYYHRFINTFPTIQSLALAKEVDVLKVWEGLGYYTRALNMLYSAKIVVKKYNGNFPKKYNELIQLKGIGVYTASAISSICNNEKRAVVDGNVYRFLSRLYNIDTPINTSKGKQKFQTIADKFIPKHNPGKYNQAVMDFGAIHCTKHNPKCVDCPFKSDCIGFELGNINFLPVKKTRKKITTRYFNYLFIHTLPFFIIQQRNKNDIWKKLYELPLIETKTKIKKATLIKYKYLTQFKISKIDNRHTIEHNLSHQKLQISFWDISVLNIHLEADMKKITFKDVNKYPFSKPLEKYLKIKRSYI